MSSSTGHPQLTNSSELRAVLQHPGVKLCLREYFDYGRCERLLQAPPEVLSDDHRKKLLRFIRASMKSADGRWFVEASYDFSTRKDKACKEKGIGRVYGDITLGTLPTDVRNYIVTDCADIDVSNSHPTCLLHACRRAGFEDQAPLLAEYVRGRGTILAEVGATYGMGTREQQKEAVIAVLNGGTPPQPSPASGRRFLHQLAKEAKVIAAVLMADPRYAEVAAAAKKPKGLPTFLHYVMTGIELDVLTSVAAYLQGCNRTIRCLIYDGLLMQLQPEEAEAGVNPELLRGAEAHVLQETGCNITLASKPMRSCFTEQLADQPACMVDDDYAAGKFVSLYGKEHLVYVQGATHIFSKLTGQWDSDTYSLRRAVHTHKKDLVFAAGKKTLNYGGSVTNINKMLDMVPNHIDADDAFYKKNLDSSQGKLLFSNGIYDFDSDTFTPGFNPSTVFAGRIDREFDRNGSAEAKAELMKVIWQDRYTQQQINDGVPLYHRIALARALYGDYRVRKAYIVVGDTATGKGVETAALERSCGSFVGTFDINNFVHNPNNGADQAKQLSWIKQIVNKRIALSSEARSNTVLCGMLLKQVVSGGDSITLRTNHTDESSHIHRSTLFMMCNDVPSIQPCDDAVQDRLGGVFEMQVRFVENPSPFRPDYEKPRDVTLKSKLDQPSYQAAFLSTLLDAYQEYRHSECTIPASVSLAIQEWVTNDSGLEGLLLELCEPQLDDATRQPLSGARVPFDALFQALVVDGVGPQRRKVAMTKTKLGKQRQSWGTPAVWSR